MSRHDSHAQLCADVQRGERATRSCQIVEIPGLFQVEFVNGGPDIETVKVLDFAWLSADFHSAGPSWELRRGWASHTAHLHAEPQPGDMLGKNLGFVICSHYARVLDGAAA